VTKVITRAKSLGQRLRNRLFGYLPNKRGNVAAIVALTMVPLSGVMGLAWEGANWFLNDRAQQNAADAAVVAAANQGLQDFFLSCAGTSTTCTPNWNATTYQQEGAGVAKQYGYVDGTNNTTVSVTNAAACPANVSITGFKCFEVTVAKPQQLYLTRLVGFSGNTTIGGAPAQSISASAIAGPVAEAANICLLTLGNGSFKKSSAFDFDGSNGINLASCPVGSNGGMTCNGHNLNAPWGISANNKGADSGCGDLDLSQHDPIPDPYASLASDIPNDNCGGNYPGTTTGGGTISQTAGSQGSPQVYVICGNVQLSGDFAVSGMQTWVIQGGTLDLNGHNLTTSNSGGLTVVFSGTPPAAVTSNKGVGYITDSAGGGGFSISSPPAGNGDFSGITLYQNPASWSGNATYSATWDGNSSKTGWDLSGGVYMPNANYVFNGAVDKAGNGYECFDMVANSIDSNGGNQFSLFATTMANPLAECGLQGTKVPQAIGYRYALVG
jgi:Flp pilus assembly protein TadG